MNYSDLYNAKEEYYYSGTNEHIIKFVPEGLNIVLDVGCSAGGFGELLKERGLTVWGVEPNTNAACAAKSKIDVVINSIFDDKILEHVKNVKFDCIFFVDVLEHIENPYTTLELCKRILKEDGYVLSVIPNILQYGTIYSIIKTQDWKYVDAGIMDKTHLRFFTKKSIVRMFQESGYDIENITGLYQKCSKWFYFLNMLLLNKTKDMKYTHFVTVAKYSSKNDLLRPDANVD